MPDKIQTLEIQLRAVVKDLDSFKKMESRLTAIENKAAKMGVKFADSTKGIKGRLDSLNQGLKNTQIHTENTRKGMDWLGSSLVRTAAKIGSVMLIAHSFQMVASALFKPIAMAAEWEQQMAGVAKTTNITGTSLGNLSNKLLLLSTEIPMTHEGLAKIAQVAGQLGIKGTQNILNFTDVVAKMGFTLDISAEEAATAIAKLDNLFRKVDEQAGVTGEHFKFLGDTINYLSNNSVATGKDLIDIATRLGGVAANLKMTSAETLGFATAMKELGAKNEVAASALIRLFTSLRSKTDTVIEGLKLTVDEGKEFRRLLDTDMSQAVLYFLGHLGQFSTATQMQILQMKGLNLSGVRTGPWIQAMANNFDKVTESMGKATDQSKTMNSMMVEFGIVTDTTKSKWQLFANAISTLVKSNEIVNYWNKATKKLLAYINLQATAGMKLKDVNKTFAEAILSSGLSGKDLGGLFGEEAISRINKLTGSLKKLDGLDIRGFYDDMTSAGGSVENFASAAESGAITIESLKNAVDIMYQKGLITEEEYKMLTDTIKTFSLNSEQTRIVVTKLAKDGLDKLSDSQLKTKLGLGSFSGTMKEAQNVSANMVIQLGILGGAYGMVTQAMWNAVHAQKAMSSEADKMMDNLREELKDFDRTGRDKLSRQLEEQFEDRWDAYLKQAVEENKSKEDILRAEEEFGKLKNAIIAKSLAEYSKTHKSGTEKLLKDDEKYHDEYLKLTMSQFDYAMLQYNKDLEAFKTLNDSKYQDSVEWAALTKALMDKHFKDIRGPGYGAPKAEGGMFDWIEDLKTLEAETNRIYQQMATDASVSQEEINKMYEESYKRREEILKEHAENEKELAEAIREAQKANLEMELDDLEKAHDQMKISDEKYEKDKERILKKLEAFSIRTELAIALQKREIEHIKNADFDLYIEKLKAKLKELEEESTKTAEKIGFDWANLGNTISGMFESGDIWKGLEGAGAGLGKALGEIFNLGDAFQKIAGDMISGFGDIMSNIMANKDDMREWFDNVANTIASHAIKIGSQLGPAGAIIGAAIAIGAKIVAAIKKGEYDKDVRGVIDEIMSEFYDVFKGTSEEAAEAMDKLAYDLAVLFEKMGEGGEEHYAEAWQRIQERLTGFMQQWEMGLAQGGEAAANAQREMDRWRQTLQKMMEYALQQGNYQMYQWAKDALGKIGSLGDSVNDTNKAIKKGSEKYFDNIANKKEKFFAQVKRDMDTRQKKFLAVQDKFQKTVVSTLEKFTESVVSSLAETTKATTDYLDLLAGETIRSIAIMTGTLIDLVDTVSGSLIDKIDEIDFSIPGSVKPGGSLTSKPAMTPGGGYFGGDILPPLAFLDNIIKTMEPAIDSISEVSHSLIDKIDKMKISIPGIPAGSDMEALIKTMMLGGGLPFKGGMDGFMTPMLTPTVIEKYPESDTYGSKYPRSGMPVIPGGGGKGGGNSTHILNINVHSNYAEDLPGTVGDALNRFIDEKGEIRFNLSQGQLINQSTSNDLTGVS